MVYDSGCDRLSELPSSIMDIILSSISTRDAVRMSVLSKHYRYAWISLPHLGFDISEFSSMECMEKFVTNVLKLHKGPILKFAISAFLEQSCPVVDKWLLLLRENEIRELILKMEPACSYGRRYELCSIAYTFNKLTRLELHSCKLGAPPLTFTGFLFLRCLILVDVDILPDHIESIVDNSPLLETLKLHSGDNFSEYPELKISAPNLKHFDLETDCVQIYLCAPFLAEMCLSVFDSEDNNLRESRSTYNFTNFFDGCTRLLKLSGNYFTEVMSYGIDSCQYSFVLPYLKVIELDDVNFEVSKQMSIVARLVSGAPNLQELILMCDPYSEESASDSDSDLEASDSNADLEAPDVSCTNFLFATCFKCEKLKIITIRSLTSLPSEIQFLKLLLEISPTLERMNVHTYGTFQKDKNLRTELLKCNLASPNFTLWFC